MSLQPRFHPGFGCFLRAAMSLQPFCIPRLPHSRVFSSLPAPVPRYFERVALKL